MNPQQQLDELRKQQIEKREFYDLLLEKKLSEVYFPKNMLSKRWRVLTKKAMRNSMPITCKAGLKQFAEAILVNEDTETEITLSQFQVLANSFDTATPDSMGLSDEEYHSFVIEELLVSINKWGELINKINDEVKLEMEQHFRMKEAVMKGNNILKPVIGEA